MQVIDIDSHSRPRPRDYSVAPEYSHLKPLTFVDARGNIRTTFDDKEILTITAGERAIANKKSKPNRTEAYYDASVRYQHIKEAGIDVQYVSAGTVAEFNYVDGKIGASFWRAFNTFLYEAFMKPYPETFIGVPQLPLQDIGEAIKELERCVKEYGMRTFIMPSNWNGIDFADRHWWNFYDRVRELGIRGILLHVKSTAAHSPWVGKERLAALGPDGTMGRRILSHPFEYATNIVNLIFGGMMDCFPEFRFAFLEAGAEFAINLKHRIEENLDQVAYLQDKLTQSLDKYFDHFYFFVDDLLLAQNGKRLLLAMEEFGAEHLFFGTDYPHEDSSLEGYAKITELTSISPAIKEKILGGNALTLFGEPLR